MRRFLRAKGIAARSPALESTEAFTVSVMAFTDDDREKIRSAVSIVDLIGDVTTIKRSGRNFMAICPFHQEKTPSMSVDAARGLYYCHGCHASGDMFTFVQESQGLTFPEAMEVLASRAGITLTRDPKAQQRRGEREKLVEAVRFAVDFYHRRLMKADDAGHARSYLRSRGYDAESVSDFKLGYAPAQRDALATELRSAGFPDKVVVDAGLGRRGRGGTIFDELTDRLLFPINDIRGDPVGFGGRILGEGQPKYRNTPETLIYKKSKLLYGLDRARSHIGRLGYAVVVEGYTDVISLHRMDLPVAVATCGTALGEDHFDLLRRFTDRIVLCFDADTAGAGAALRGDSLETPVRLDLDLRVVDMQPGTDPADMAQAGKTEELRDAIERARPLLQFRIEKELAGFDLTEPEGRARAIHTIAPRLRRIEDEITRNEYARFLASRAGVDPGQVYQAIGTRSRRQPSMTTRRSRGEDHARTRLETELLRSMLADGGAAAGKEKSIFTDDRLTKAFERIQPTLKGLGDGEPVPIPSPDDEISQLLVNLAMDERPVAAIDDIVRRLDILDIERRIAELREGLATLDPEEQTSSEAFQELVRLQAKKRDREST